jgi:hypothetical protein
MNWVCSAKTLMVGHSSARLHEAKEATLDARARALVARRNGEARPWSLLRFNQARPC